DEADPLRNEVDPCAGSATTAPQDYPDVPTDLLCDGQNTPGPTCQWWPYSPVFFGTQMLWDIKTYVLTTATNTGATSDWNTVLQYQMKYAMPNPDGPVSEFLWLDYIQREGYYGPDIQYPVINFNGTDMDNAVGAVELNFRRITTVY